jgi:hypothetical protein
MRDADLFGLQLAPRLDTRRDRSDEIAKLSRRRGRSIGAAWGTARKTMMKIAQIALLMESVPPRLYGGTERIVSYLTENW